ncbi:family 16 glycosylhydrolase [Limimaricola sp.]|uniref:family 16 glycosylhydrolase n=1 Tax=Limimaricola sp. TaxID=2211665 RepID=UPI0040595ED2
MAEPAAADEAAPGFILDAGEFSRADIQPQWFTSNFDIKTSGFRTAWRKALVSTEDGRMVLQLRPAPDGHDKDFLGSEVQRRERTHYGRYEVVMTAARGDGVISSFFTYTGPWFDDPHDEIDFEFLGRDTTKVWAMAFADGQKLSGRWIDLGFDAAEAPHLYAFEWHPDRIVWYVDGKEILRITEADGPLPQTPGKIYANIWAGGKAQRNWSGEAPIWTRAAASYDCMSYRPFGVDAPQCSDRSLRD